MAVNSHPHLLFAIFLFPSVYHKSIHVSVVSKSIRPIACKNHQTNIIESREQLQQQQQQSITIIGFLFLSFCSSLFLSYLFSHPLQQTILHVNDPISRVPSAVSISDVTRFAKQGQQRQQQQQQQQLLANDQQQPQQNQPNAKAPNANIHSNNNKPTTINGSSNANKAQNAKKINEYVSSQENNGPINANSRFQSNPRNRLHPLSTTKSPFGSLLSRTAFQSVATTGAPIPTTTSTAATTPIPATTSRIDDDSLVYRKKVNGFEANRGGVGGTRFDGQTRDQGNNNNAANPNRVNKLLRQPLFAGRETLQQTIKRINVTHNGSANRDASQEVTNRTHQLQLLQRARQKLRSGSEENASRVEEPVQEPKFPIKATQGVQIANVGDEEPVDEGEEVFYEDDEVDDKENPAEPDTATPKSSEENKPVILTSNFFLPGKPIPTFENHDLNENQKPNDLSNDGEVNEEPNDTADDVIDEEPPLPASRPAENETRNEKPASHPVDLKVTKPVVEDPNVEYEYEYEEYVDEPTTTVKQTIKHDQRHQNIALDEQRQHDDQFHANTSDEDTRHDSHTTEKSTTVDETTKSSVHGAQIETSVDSVETSSVSPTTATKENMVESTESYVVVASVQTSRSISGARFLTFPQVEQEEKKQSLSELDKEAKDRDDAQRAAADNDELKSDDLLAYHNDTDGSEEDIENVTEISADVSETNSEASKTVKTKVHKLSSVSEKLAHLHELNEPKAEFTTKSVPVVIRKFTPRTTIPPTRKPSVTHRPTAPSTTTTTTEFIHLPSIKPIEDFDDDLASLLPPGFKLREPHAKSQTTPTVDVATRATPSVEKKKPIALPGLIFEEISLESLLPKGYKPIEEKPIVQPQPKSNQNDVSKILAQLNFDDNIEALLPRDYKVSMHESTPTTKPPFRQSTVTEDVSKFLPSNYKSPKESTTTKRTMLKTTMDDISKFLPPGYKLPKTTAPTTTTTTTTTEPSVEIQSSETEPSQEILSKIKSNADISSLLPPGFASNGGEKEAASDDEGVAQPAGGSNPNFKLIFPKSIRKRPGARVTTSKPTLKENEGIAPPGITIRKGLPVR